MTHPEVHKCAACDVEEREKSSEVPVSSSELGETEEVLPRATRREQIFSCPAVLLCAREMHWALSLMMKRRCLDVSQVQRSVGRLPEITQEFSNNTYEHICYRT